MPHKFGKFMMMMFSFDSDTHSDLHDWDSVRSSRLLA